MAIQKVDISPLGSDGTIWNGNVGVSSGTITSLPNLPGGTLNSVTITGGTVSVNELSGTINLGTAVLNDGTIDVVKNAGTIQGGSIVVTTGTINAGTINLGTVVGKDANAAAQTGSPIGVGGTDSGGTIRTILVDSTGVQRSSGSMVMTVGTVTVLPNLPQGSINVTAGTIASVGTIGTLGLGTVVSTGTVNAGTINTGTINTGTVNLGTFVGKDANAAAQTGNPISIGGTDSGGTVRTVLVNSAGAMSVSGASSGTFVNLSTGTLNAGTINVGTFVMSSGTLNVGTATVNQTSGTLNVGTINTGTVNLGTFVGKDSNAAAQTGNPVSIGGTDSGGTVRTVLVNSAGAMSVSGASSGTFNNISTGTMQTLGTVGTIQNILAGTISGLQNGTIATGTINTGTVSVAVGTINHGTIDVGTVSIGTIKDNFAGLGTFTISLGSLANSGSVGRQSTIIDNTVNLYSSALVSAQVTIGSTASTANTLISLYLFRSDNGAPIITDGWGATDAAATVHNAPLLGNILVDTAGTNLQFASSFDTTPLGPLGPKWGVAVVNNSGGSLHPTVGSQSITYIGITRKS